MSEVGSEKEEVRVEPAEVKEQDSRIGKVSVRALIAIIMVSTVCAMGLAYCAVDAVVSLRTGQLPTFEIGEPLYSGFMVAIGAYLGKSLAERAKR